MADQQKDLSFTIFYLSEIGFLSSVACGQGIKIKLHSVAFKGISYPMEREAMGGLPAQPKLAKAPALT